MPVDVKYLADPDDDDNFEVENPRDFNYLPS